MEIKTFEKAKRVQNLNQVLQYLKSSFIGKDEIIDLMGICLVSRENLFLLGPPGTAKSAMVKALASQLRGQNFEYLLTRFTEPNELFGPFDIRKLREGELVTNTEGMLPEASLIFLDELLNANSAILNSLLMVLNERVFRRGRESKDLPVLMIVGASNHLPEDEALQALFDRFLVRVRCDNVAPEMLADVLEAGWRLEQKNGQVLPEVSVDDIADLQKQLTSVDLSGIKTAYIELIQSMRNAGVKVSDRRAVKLQRLIAASALICNRMEAIPSDMWVLRYIWDTDEQREVIAGIVAPAIEADETPEQKHPQADQRNLPDAEEIFKEVMALTKQWEKAETSLAEQTVIKDRLRYLNGRSQWISNETQRQYIQEPIDKLWKKIIATS